MPNYGGPSDADIERVGREALELKARIGWEFRECPTCGSTDPKVLRFACERRIEVGDGASVFQRPDPFHSQPTTARVEGSNE